MFRIRQYFIFFLLIFLFSFLFIRLFYLQVLRFGDFSRLANEQQTRIFEIQPQRGIIYDRYMESLAANSNAPSIYCDPSGIENAELTAASLSEIVHIEKPELMRKFSKGGLFAWIKRGIDDSDAKKIKEKKLPGIYIVDESKRNYPNDNMASHIIGFTGIDNDGLEGLELLYNNELKGKAGWRHLIKDARKRTVLFNEEDSIPPQNGFNLILTIDNVMQCIVEDELRSMVKKFNARGASIIVMNPFSGEILALANYPDYKPGAFSSIERDTVKNAAISDVYEPGSVFKIVTASAILEEDLISLNDEVYCENGQYAINGRILHDYHPYGKLTFREVIGKSSNIGTVKVAQKLGKKRFFDYIKKFGFGKKTEINLPGEVSGITRPQETWTPSDMTTIPMGQGIAVTPIQLACAISVIANGGYLVKPYIVGKITTWEGYTYKEFKPEAAHQILSGETCIKMKDILNYVVTTGTGKLARPALHEACGKTGTSQMVNPAGGYYPDKYNATFIGFAPKENPVISVVIVAYDPHPAHFGGSVAGPAFKNITERILQYLNIKGKSNKAGKK